MWNRLILAALGVMLAAPAVAQTQAQAYFKNSSSVVVPVTPSAPLPVTNTPAGTQDVNLTKVAGTAVAAGNGATTAGTLRVTISNDSTGVISPSSTALGNPTGNATTPFASQMMVSDGTNNQRLIAPISLTDGVNGNNSVAVGNYVWNGSSWDRAPGSAAITPVVSASLEASHVLKASAGNVYSVYASNLTGGAAGFLVLINATSAPVDGAITPLACAPFSGGVAQINYAGLPPAVFSTGITAVVTSATTCFTKTTGVLTAYLSGMVK